jgi:MinD superfamily P-loop ATPase
VAKQEKRDLVLVDGPPGTGCPVIAAVTGASSLLVVTEPTVSGEHDLDRVLKLARHFRIPAAVCINKWDLHRELTERIEANARAAGVIPVGRVRYDKAATAAQRQGLAVVEAGPGPLADDIRAVWTTWMAALDAPLPQTSS